MNKQEVEQLIEPHLFTYQGKKAIELESGTLNFKQTYIYYGVTPAGRVKLGEIYYYSPKEVKTRGKIGKIRIIGGKKTLTVGSGRGTDNYYLDLE